MNTREELNNSDLISRQAAIDALGDMPEVWTDDDEYAKGCASQWESDVLAIKAMPSAQPEIIRCKECKHHWIYRCMDSMPSEICDLNQTFYDPNIDFCSLAERRTDDLQ